MKYRYVVLALIIGLILYLALASIYKVSESPFPLENDVIGEENDGTSVPALIGDTTQNEPSSSIKYEIIYSENGFSPADFQVPKGTEIEFVNNSQTPFWPASAVHPTHNVYPTKGGCIGSTFDACKAILPGETWSFVFDISGLWKYHDHLNPSHQGNIVVN